MLLNRQNSTYSVIICIIYNNEVYKRDSFVTWSGIYEFKFDDITKRYLWLKVNKGKTSELAVGQNEWHP